ncbi:MAG: site-2 protease family protein [Chloroflexota bacterium]
MRASFKLGRIAGIDIGVHSSWLLAFFLIAWSLSVGVFPVSYRGWSQTAYWLAGFLSAFLLFVSVLLHELAHSLVAKARGMSVSSIILFIFGGVSNLESEPAKPLTEFVMAIVGPLTSAVLGGILLGLAFVLGPVNSLPVAVVRYLAQINLLLAAFNLIPGFPLDGGRVLRSIIWGASHDLKRATNSATMVGQLFGWGFIGLGLYLVLRGNLINGLWIAFIGWFLNNAAESSRREVSVREYLQGVRVREVMDPSPECVKPGDSVAGVVQGVFYQRGYRATPVCEGERVVGIVTISDVKKLTNEEWASTPISSIMTRQPLYQVRVDDDLNSALRLLSEHGLNQLLVLDGERLAGLLSRAHVIRYLQLNQELGVRPKRQSPAAPTTP